MLTLGSLFDGIGGWLLAARHNGVKPIWSSEIEKFPMAVTKHHFPDVIQLGDITKLDGATLPPVDIICAGSPCQDLSVAGKREGLKGERSGLFRTTIDIVRQMRMSTGGVHPRFYIWENVLGALSSNEGMDFCTVLEHVTNSKIPMPGSGRWANAGLVRSRHADVGWRVFDGQYFGTPCRRKRLFLIADLNCGERCAGKILFESNNNNENVEVGKGKKQATTPTNQTCSETTTDDFLRVWENHPADSRVTGPHKICPTLTTWEDDVPLVFDYNYGKIVRKLTPLEVERLHGLPDNYTFLDDKICNDRERYKAVGNGMCQNVADFLIKRIVEEMGECDENKQD